MTGPRAVVVADDDFVVADEIRDSVAVISRSRYVSGPAYWLSHGEVSSRMGLVTRMDGAIADVVRMVASG